MKVGEALIEAAKKQAEGEVAVHIANIEVYKAMPAGIGEHSDVMGPIDGEINAIAQAHEKIEIINHYFLER